MKVQLTVGPFWAAVRQAAIVTSEERRGVDFVFSEGKVTLAAHGAEFGESHIELPIAYEGAELGITLDPRYLNDFLRVLDPEQTLLLELRDAESAAVCSTEDGYAYVIMRWPGTRKPNAKTDTGKPRGPERIGDILPEIMARRGFARIQSGEQI